MMFSRTKMNINGHLHFLPKMSSQCHMPSNTCYFKFWRVTIDVCIFSFTSHTTCQNLNCACQLTCIFILCKVSRVNRDKNLQKLCQRYTLIAVLHKQLCCPRILRNAIAFISFSSSVFSGQGFIKRGLDILLLELKWESLDILHERTTSWIETYS